MTGDDWVVVFSGGDPVDPALRERVVPGARVVAADSGLHHAQALGVDVDVVVGDLDSVADAPLATAVRAGARVEQYPTDKDATDLELALHTAATLGATRVRVIGGAGGRIDHFLANLLLLAAPDFASLHVDAYMGDAHVTVVRGQAALTGAAGSLLTLVALGAPARNVRTQGLRYPLKGEDLFPGSTRGVSNEFVDTDASVDLDDGVLLAIQPYGGAR
jgi:thiamine pyrophosphokinase